MDIEKSMVRHFVKLESFDDIWAKGIRSEHFFDDGVRELALWPHGNITNKVM